MHLLALVSAPTHNIDKPPEYMDCLNFTPDLIFELLV